jgi:DNA polymerase III delta subunit
MNGEAQTNVVLVTGDDAAMIEAEVAQVIRRVAGDSPDAFSLDILRERDGLEVAELLRQVLRSLQSPPFLGQRKTVWLRGFTGFESESASAKPKTAEASALRELAERITKGIPADLALVMDGPGAAADKPLARACTSKGKVIVCTRPTLRGKEWRSDMREVISRRAAEKGVRLPEEVAEFLTDAIGTDTSRIESELEKLICYVGGPGQPITRAAAEAVCVGQGEELPWALTNALGRRNLTEALRVIQVVLEQSRDDGSGARSLLSQTAKYFRELLQVKVFMTERGLRSPAAVQSAVQRATAEERQGCLADGLVALTGSPFRAKALAMDADAYSGPELIEAVRAARDAYLRCITSSVSERIVLEELVTRVAAPSGVPTQGR